MRPTERFTKCHMQVESVHKSMNKFDDFLNQFKRSFSVPKNMIQNENVEEKKSPTSIYRQKN